MSGKKALAWILIIVFGLMALDGALGFVLTPAQIGSGVSWTTSWAQDTTCGYTVATGTNQNCWTTSQALGLNGPTMTVTDTVVVHTQVGVAGQGKGLDFNAVAFTITVKNNGPPVIGTSGEIAQPVYVQVTSIPTILSSQGVPLKIVNISSLNQQMIAYKDFSSNTYIAQSSQFLLGTLLSGASNTFKFEFDLMYAAFQNKNVLAAGQNYVVSGNVNGNPFTLTVQLGTVT